MSFWRSKPPSNRMFPDPMVSGSSVTSGRCCAAAGSENSTIIQTNASFLLIELETPLVAVVDSITFVGCRAGAAHDVFDAARAVFVGLAPHERERHRGEARRRLVPELGERIEAAVE